MRTPENQRLAQYSFIFFLAFGLLFQSAFAGPGRRKSKYRKQSVGVRLGWSGAPNGLTYRTVVAPGQAFEFTAGYNSKMGRRLDVGFAKKGNSFIGASYAPFLFGGNGQMGFGVNADFGLRARIHHYRTFSDNKITPDLLAGIGVQLEISEKVEVFADCHLKYYNHYSNYYRSGIESGAGMRILLGN